MLNRITLHFVTSLAAGALVACGGGDQFDASASKAESAASRLIAVPAALSTIAAVDPNTAGGRKQASAVASGVAAPTTVEVFSLLERKLSTLYSGASPTIQADGFVFRYYSKTLSYIGIKPNGEIYTLGPNGILVYFGLNTSLTCEIKPTVCTKYVVSKVTADPTQPVQPYMMYAQRLTVRVVNATTGLPVMGQKVNWEGAGNGYAVPTASLVTTGMTNSLGEMTVAWVAGDSLAPALTASVANPMGEKFSTVFNATTLPPTLIDGSKTPNSAYAFSWGIKNAVGFSSDLTPNTDPTGTYYAMQWLDGYTGLQRGGSHFDRQVQFSLWNKAGVRSSIVNTGTSTCLDFSHEGSGVMCSAQYDWAIDKTYRFEVTTAKVVTGYTDYTVHVVDVAANTKRFIATLRQFGTNSITSAIFFSEDFKRDYQGCKNVPEKLVSIANIRVQSVTKVWGTAIAENRYVYSSNPQLTCANSGYTNLGGLGIQIGIGGTAIRTTNTTGQWESLLSSF